MKMFALASLAALGLSFPAFAQVVQPPRPGDVKLGKVAPAVDKTPEYNVVGGQNKRFKNKDWLEVEVEYETKAEEIPELTFKFTALIAKTLVEGEVTYINIPKEREHYAIMYIPPRTLEKLTGGKPLSPADIVNAWVTVSYSGQILDQGAYKPGMPIPNLPHQPGFLTKDQTPFAPLYYDRYETQKPASR